MSFFANIYERGQSYGGPEEGGWWVDTYEPRASVPCATEAEAEAVLEALRAGEWADDEDAPAVWSVAYRGGRYAGWVEDRPAYFQPEEWPRYE